MAQHNFNKTLKPFQVISQTVVLVGILIGTTLWLGACGDKATIDEKITVINNTGAEIKVVRCASTPKLWKLGAKPEGPDVARAEFGPIPPGESDSITLKVWPDGFFTVEADVNDGGETKLSRSYTANLDPKVSVGPITPVTLTLGVIAGTWFAWQEVRWDSPKD